MDTTSVPARGVTPEPRFIEPKVDEQTAARLQTELGITPLFARILAARGFSDAAVAERFMTPSLERDWRDPFTLPGMAEVAERIARAVREHERICIFGDYDLDGVSATALALRGLHTLGADACCILPLRLEDGYGLTEGSVRRIKEQEAHLILTVDCGISAAPEVAVLREAGMDVVITDHHEPGENIPQGVPICNPRLNPAYDSDGVTLAGAGVSLKMVQAVGSLLGAPNVWRGLVDLATLGTVADVMPLRGENRALVAAGIEKIRLDPQVGIAALAALAKVPCEIITAERISYSLAPRLNAAGRMATPIDALKLLMSDDPLEAAELAGVLDEHNKARQLVEAEMVEGVTATLERTYHGEPGIVLAQEGWHDGVKGIVASRVAQRYHVPTVLCSIEEGMAVGSGRSVGEVDLFKALEACSDHLDRFGGHAGAAGMATPVAEVDAFRTAFCSYLASLPTEQFAHVTRIDAVAEIDELTLEAAHEIESLEPFGECNPRPLLLTRAAAIKNACTVGRDGAHLKFQAYGNGQQISAIYFRCPAIEHVVHEVDLADLLYRFEIDSWQGRERVQMMVKGLVELPDPDRRSEKPTGDVEQFLQELYEVADSTFKHRNYEGILDAETFYTKLTGVTFEGRQDAIAQVQPGEPLLLRRDPMNEYDANAVAIFAPRLDAQLGYLKRDLAAVLAPAIDAGERTYSVSLSEVTGRDRAPEPTLGVNVLIERDDLEELQEERVAYRTSRRAALKALPSEELQRQLVAHFIGEHTLHPAQADSLAALNRGENTLTVMATGRGKSLIFHLFAAEQALLHDKASVFVYPLRALVADQAFHLQESFAELGLRVEVVTGETAQGKRDEAFAAYASGELDIILTTPEFLHFHADRFASAARVGFVVVDEAHHIGQARAGNRPSYAHLGEAIARLNGEHGAQPVILAVTATAGAEVAARICTVLGIKRRVLDPSVRNNLTLDDTRGTERKQGRVLDLIRAGGKSVIYVNSREESVKIARFIRRAEPDLAWKTAFYNGGLDKTARHEIERRFRTGEVQVCVATSAFGEGVNIPDIRHVLLYHLPYNDVEFNQMAGRAGRDGAKATIHLLFGEQDTHINEFILSSLAPERDALASVYAVLKTVDRQEGAGFSITNAEIAERANRTLLKGISHLTEGAVSTGISVFRELGFLQTEGHASARRITMEPAPGKLALSESTRYVEGREQIDAFAQFKEWVLHAPADELLNRFNKPILPDAVD